MVSPSNCSDANITRPPCPTAQVQPFRRAVLYYNCFISLPALFTNGITIVAFFRYRKLQTLMNTSLVLLSFSDFIMALTSEFYSLVQYSDLLQGIPHLCVASLAMPILICGCSLSAILLISIDRLIGTVFPFWYKAVLTKRRVVFVELIMWLYMGAWALLPLSGLRVCDPLQCSMRILPVSFRYIIIAHSGLFMLMIPVIYSPVVWVACRHQRKVKSMYRHHYQTNPSQPRFRSHSYDRKQYRLHAMMTLILGGFYLFWTPHFVFFIMRTVYLATNEGCEEEESHYIGYNVSLALAFTSALINPIIYVYKSRDFRTAFLAIITFKPSSAAQLQHTPSYSTMNSPGRRSCSIHSDIASASSSRSVLRRAYVMGKDACASGRNSEDSAYRPYFTL